MRCFVAYRDISKDKVWADIITMTIEQSQMMVVAFYKEFNLSDQIDRKIGLCSKKKNPSSPFASKKAEFIGSKKYYLKNPNWIDVSSNIAATT